MTLREFYLRVARVAKRYGNRNVVMWCLRQVQKLLKKEMTQSAGTDGVTV